MGQIRQRPVLERRQTMSSGSTSLCVPRFPGVRSPAFRRKGDRTDFQDRLKAGLRTARRLSPPARKSCHTPRALQQGELVSLATSRSVVCLRKTKTKPRSSPNPTAGGPLTPCPVLRVIMEEEISRVSHHGQSESRQKFSLFSDHWHPRIVGELNGQQVKLAKLQGEFIWHITTTRTSCSWS